MAQKMKIKQWNELKSIASVKFKEKWEFDSSENPQKDRIIIYELMLELWYRKLAICIFTIIFWLA